jgi:hypothetical protein
LFLIDGFGLKVLRVVLASARRSLCREGQGGAAMVADPIQSGRNPKKEKKKCMLLLLLNESDERLGKREIDGTHICKS